MFFFFLLLNFTVGMNTRYADKGMAMGIRAEYALKRRSKEEVERCHRNATCFKFFSYEWG